MTPIFSQYPLLQEFVERQSSISCVDVALLQRVVEVVEAYVEGDKTQQENVMVVAAYLNAPDQIWETVTNFADVFNAAIERSIFSFRSAVPDHTGLQAIAIIEAAELERLTQRLKKGLLPQGKTATAMKRQAREQAAAKEASLFGFLDPIAPRLAVWCHAAENDLTAATLALPEPPVSKKSPKL